MIGFLLSAISSSGWQVDQPEAAQVLEPLNKRWVEWAEPTWSCHRCQRSTMPCPLHRLPANSSVRQLLLDPLTTCSLWNIEQKIIKHELRFPDLHRWDCPHCNNPTVPHTAETFYDAGRKALRRLTKCISVFMAV